MKFRYKTKGTCAQFIDIEIEGDIIKDIVFYGGCDGNLQAIPKLCQGRTVDEVSGLLSGISCNGKGTSCGDQLARGLRQAMQLADEQANSTTDAQA